MQVANEPYEIRELTPEVFAEVKNYCDEDVGTGYYSISDLQRIYENSLQSGMNTSFVAFSKEEEVIGVFFNLCGREWVDNQKGLTVQNWYVDLDDALYCDAVFIKKPYRRMGVGHSFFRRLLPVMAHLKYKAIAGHVCANSPENPLYPSFEKRGFQEVKTHDCFWQDRDYDCSYCEDTCECAGIEMVFYAGTESKWVNNA